MNTPVIKKPENKGKAKPVTTKPVTTKAGADQEKAINHLRQEIRTLAKAFKDMQQKPDTQAIIVEIPQELFAKLTVHLSEFSQSLGRTVSLSEFICEAIWFSIYCDEENNRIEDEEKKGELEKNKQEKIQD